MPESDSERPPRRRDAMKNFLKQELHRGHDKLLAGKLKFEHSLGLGHQPNVIPPAVPDIAGAPRKVFLGWHPVAGFAGKWFADKTGLGKLLTEKLHKCPDPTQHWAILVGDYVHELWMDENLDIIYLNERIKPEEWHTFEVGSTRFNDEALRRAGEMTIYNMRSKQPAYNLITNNCQLFALQMLDAVQVGKHVEFATTYSVYQTALTGASVKHLGSFDQGLQRVSTLFATQAQEAAQETAAATEADTEGMALFAKQAQTLPTAEEEAAEHPPHHVLKHAQEVMAEETTTLDDHDSLFHSF
ncbi:hypothetical protein MSAN_01624500 [Mycena sanguinolenta]|uniref:PPPDE domain-containing protein n=1 Tax=Mycena sanguinolenta TaxID=230812 RepID=A0A8H6Y0V6_9AGAR|nr:hypothetical protein MSAN_01624500 [Mycena sanguinolenta]